MRRLACLALAIGVAGVMPAGPFGVQPDVLTLTAATPVAQLEFSSLYAQTRIVDVRVMRWTQRNGENVLIPDDGFIIVPAVFAIDPYRTQIIRIKQRASAAAAVEQSYKVVVTNVVPGAATPPPTARRIEATLFVPPPKLAPEVAFVLKHVSPGAADLVVTNRGNAHVYLGKVSIEVAQHKVYDGTIADYVLANGVRTFRIRVNGLITESNADLTFDDAQGRQQMDRVVVTR